MDATLTGGTRRPQFLSAGKFVKTGEFICSEILPVVDYQSRMVSID